VHALWQVALPPPPPSPTTRQQELPVGQLAALEQSTATPAHGIPFGMQDPLRAPPSWTQHWSVAALHVDAPHAMVGDPPLPGVPPASGPTPASLPWVEPCGPLGLPPASSAPALTIPPALEPLTITPPLEPVLPPPLPLPLTDGVPPLLDEALPMFEKAAGAGSPSIVVLDPQPTAAVATTSAPKTRAPAAIPRHELARSLNSTFSLPAGTMLHDRLYTTRPKAASASTGLGRTPQRVAR
jgi:hypothetical protein